MALDYELDLDASLVSDIEKPNLYDWCIREFDATGEQVGCDLIPYPWSVVFHATEFDIFRSIYSESKTRIEVSLDKDPLNFTTQDIISAKLKSGNEAERYPYPPRFSMIGSSRRINDINLRIERLENTAEEGCNLWATVAYQYEHDFRQRREEDALTVTFYLSSEKFDSLFDLIASKKVERIIVGLRGVNGFYAGWSPSISTDEIKILENPENQRLELLDDWGSRIPMIGKVDQASIRVGATRFAKLPITSDEDELDSIENNNDDYQDTRISSTSNSENAREASQYKFFERSLSRISKLLGILIVIEFIKAFSS